MSRRKTLSINITKPISHVGTYIPHVAVGILKKKRKRPHDLYRPGGSKSTPLVHENPFPYEGR